MPGRVQPHGVLLALRNDGTIAQVSANTDRVLDRTAQSLLDKPAALALGAQAGAAAQSLLDGLAEGEKRACPVVLADGAPAWITAHRWRGRRLVELEPVTEASGTGLVEDVPARMTALGHEDNPFRLCQMAAELVRDLTGYDRVMVYRFHPDWSGEVAAEVRRPDAVPFLGLRYPASDIPEQARRLYMDSKVRVIADVDAIMAPLVPEHDPETGAPLDIGITQLRAMSPVHIEYLRNMRVRATLTASITVEGRLWGLIACHHDSSRPALPPERAEVEGVAGALAVQLAAIGSERRRRSLDIAKGRADRLVAALEKARAGQRNAAAALLFGTAGLRSAVRADGWAVLAGPALASAAGTPSHATVRRLAGIVAARKGPGLFISTACGEDLDLPDLEPECCGLLALVASVEPLCVLMCFSGELMQEVAWGGDPNKPAILDAANQRLTPRKSFELWRTTVRGTARPWRPEDVELFRQLETRLRGVSGICHLVGEGIRRLALSEAGRAELSAELLDVIDEGTVTLADLRDGGIGRVHALNRRFREAFGLGPEEMENNTITGLLHRCGLPPDLASMEGETVRECEGWDPDRGRRVFRIHRHVVVDFETEDARSGLVLLSLVDITEFRGVEEALRGARDQALAAERSRAAFLAGVSHELRTPLNAILGFSELLTLAPFGPLGNPRYDGYIADIHQAGEHLLSLVNDVLEMARLQSGQPVLEEVEFDLRDPLREACRMLSGKAEISGVILDLRLPAVLMHLRADRRGMKQIALNLLSNAIKYGPPGTEVSIRAGWDDGEPGGDIWFEVADTGIGITDADRERLFKPFQRAGDDVAQKKPGSGLGLSLVKAITDIHAGQVSLDSRYGHGTKVRVTLPGWRCGRNGET